MPPAPPSPSAQDMRELASLLHAQDPAAGEAAARAWTTRHPAHAAGWAVLGELLQRQGRHADALPALQQAAALAGDDAGLQHKLGSALRRLGRLDEAAARFQRALALQPERAASHHGLANALRDMGQLEPAMAHYRAALRLDPTHAEACLNLGNACQEHGDALAAEAAYLQAATLRPDWAAPHFNRHALRLAAGDAAGALDAMAAAVAREPGQVRHRFFLGLLLERAGRTQEAQTQFAALQHGPAIGRAWLDAWQHLRSAHEGLHRPLCGTAQQTFAHAAAAARPDGLVLEFGVRWGRSIRQIAALVPGPVHGFDSFEGLPEAWHHEPEGSYSTGGRLPAVPPQVTLHPGWFDATLPAFLQAHPGPARLVNIDCDLYSSTATVLALLAPRIGPGTVLVFDEYIGNLHWRDDEFKAFHEAVAREGWAFEMLCFSFATKQVAMRLLPA